MTLKVGLTPLGLPLVTVSGATVLHRDSGGVRSDLGVVSYPFVDVSAPKGPARYYTDTGETQMVNVPDGGGGVFLLNGKRLDVFNVDNQDPVDYDTGGTVHNLVSGGQTAVYPLSPPAPKVTVVCVHSHTDPDMAGLVVESGLVWVRQDHATRVVPQVRLVAVDTVTRTRGYDTVTVEVQGACLWDCDRGGRVPAGVVASLGGATYADARSVGFHFGDGSYLDLVERVQKRGAV